MSSKILIAGPGYVGGELTLKLNKRGYLVETISRSKKHLPESIPQHLGDLSQPQTYTNLKGNYSYCFYLAGADSRSHESYRRTYVEGPKTLLKAVGAVSNNFRFIFSSSTSVYGQNAGEWVDESSATEPIRETSKIILEGEEAILSNHSNTLIVRFSGIYGPGRERFLKNALSLPADEIIPAIYTNRIHRDDCVGVLEHLMNLPEESALSTSPIFIGSDCDPSSKLTVVNWLREQNELPDLGVEISEAGMGNKRCSNSKLAKTGYSFLYPSFRDGYGSMLKRDKK